MAQNINNSFSVRSVLEKDKLTWTNFLDWSRNLRIVLRQERKSHVIETPPVHPGDNATRAQLNTYQKHLKDATNVACLMLATMSSELRKQHELMDTYAMLEHLQTMYQEQARQERYNTSKALFACKQQNNPVGPHVLKMIGYIDYLECLGFGLAREAQINIILQSLNNNYSQFIMTFTMTKQDKTPTELLALLRTTKANMQKASESAPIMMVGDTGAKGKGKWKGKQKTGYKVVAPSNPTFKKALKPKGGVTKTAKGDCH